MWAKLGNDYLNLDQIVRVRFNRAIKNGHEEWVAELEALIKGEVQVFTRYRGADAEFLRDMLSPRPAASGGATVEGPIHALTNTLHDVKVG